MKKLSILLLSVLLCASLCACSGAKSEGETTTAGAPQSDTTITDGVTGDSPVIEDEQDNSTPSNNNSEQEATEQDNVHVNAGDLV